MLTLALLFFFWCLLWRRPFLLYVNVTAFYFMCRLLRVSKALIQVELGVLRAWFFHLSWPFLVNLLAMGAEEAPEYLNQQGVFSRVLCNCLIGNILLEFEQLSHFASVVPLFIRRERYSRMGISLGRSASSYPILRRVGSKISWHNIQKNLHFCNIIGWKWLALL